MDNKEILHKMISSMQKIKQGAENEESAKSSMWWYLGWYMKEKIYMI